MAVCLFVNVIAKRTANGTPTGHWLNPAVRCVVPASALFPILVRWMNGGRLGMLQTATAQGLHHQRRLFDDVAPRWVEVDTSRIRVERCVDFGGPWLAMKLLKHLGLESLLNKLFPAGREEIEWSLMAIVLVICRLCNPSSELNIAEHLYGHTALVDLLGVAEDKINDDRLYRALDKLLVHKEALEVHLKERLGRLFHLEYDILFYDITSTYFEGQANGNPLAQRGYSRDHRGDCKQVCIGLVVSKCGMPLGYELFAGNRRDMTTLEEMVVKMERRYGKADRIWVLDRGMVDEEDIEFLRAGVGILLVRQDICSNDLRRSLSARAGLLSMRDWK